MKIEIDTKSQHDNVVKFFQHESILITPQGNSYDIHAQMINKSHVVEHENQ